MKPTTAPRSSRRQRGATLTEVALAAGISTTVLIAGVSVFLVGMRSWIKGEANMDVSSNSQKALRAVSNELREAMSVTVNTDGLGVTYVRPKRESDGSFTNPMVSDGVNRAIELSGTDLLIKGSGSPRKIARNVLKREPGQSSDYRIFTAPVGAVSRSLTIKLVAGKTGVSGDSIVERSRETVFLRNVPQLSR